MSQPFGAEETDRPEMLPRFQQRVLRNEQLLPVRNHQPFRRRVREPHVKILMRVQSRKLRAPFHCVAKVLPHFAERQALRFGAQPALRGLNVLVLRQREGVFAVKVDENLNWQFAQILFHQRLHLLFPIQFTMPATE